MTRVEYYERSKNALFLQVVGLLMDVLGVGIWSATEWAIPSLWAILIPGTAMSVVGTAIRLTIKEPPGTVE